jgi:two-component system, cell cycle response regulator
VKHLKETISALGRGSMEDGSGRAHVVVVSGKNAGESYPVQGPVMVIGRGFGADLRVEDEGVSRAHAKLIEEPVGVFIEDLGSRNGTFCNGVRVGPGSRKLEEGDSLQIGTTFVLRFTRRAVAGNQTSNLSQTSDPVTGSSSRRHLMELLEGGITAPSRNRLSIAMVHIDGFEKLSTSGGPAVVDQLAIAVADHVRGNLRRDDVLARLDPGLFAVLCRNASPGDVYMQAERTRRSAPSITLEGGGAHQVSLSIGIASVAELPVDNAHQVMTAAGTALYRAQSAGGNRVVLCTPDLLGEPTRHFKV